MKRKTLFTVLFMAVFGAVMAQAAYKAVGNNLITNSTFNSDIQNWTVDNPISNGSGWRWDSSFTYGTSLWIDNGPGTFTASSNTMNLCQNFPKQVKFSFASSNMGNYEMVVKLSGQVIGTFTQSGNRVQSLFTPAEGVVGSISVFYNYWPSHYVTDGKINNNVWHDFTLIIPTYQGAATGSLTFEYTRTGLSRSVYLDNVEVHELLPTPVPAQTNVYLPNCDAGTRYNLTTLQPADPKYSYIWYRGTSPGMTNSVSDPTKVEVGTYHLFSESVCTGTAYSHPSVAVTVHGASGCCGANVIKDGTFSETDPSNSPSGYLVPKGDNSNNKGIYWRRSFTDNDAQNPIRSEGGQNVFYAVSASSSAWPRAIYQENTKISRWGVREIEFDFFYATTSNTDPSIVVLSQRSDSASYFSGNPAGAFSPYVLRMQKAENYTTRWRLDFPSGGIMVYVDNTSATSGATYNCNQKYRIKIIVPANYSTNTHGGFGFVAGRTVSQYIGNISVKVSNPNKPNLTNTTLQANCSDGSADLTTLAMAGNVTNYLAGLQYRWFTANSSTGTMVPDPQKAAPGTYYLFAFNPDTQCYSDEATVVTVTKNCPVISGTVYDDWDGVSAGNGINNRSPVQDAALYALLMNPTTHQVVKSMQLTAAGTFSFDGVANTQYYVMISGRNAAPGTAVSLVAPYPTGTVSTGETVGGTLDGTADGKSASFTTGANSGSVTTVNFGINRIPIQDNITSAVCGVQQTIVLSSIESEPDWNGGVGKKLIIYSVTQLTNGTLTYDGNPVSAPYTINAYDTTKLVFTPTNLHQLGSLEFTYAFEDAAGHSTLNSVTPPEPAKASFVLRAVPVIGDKILNIQSRQPFSYTPQNGVDGNVVPDGTKYSWTPLGDPIWGVSGITSGEEQDSISGTIYNYCAYQHTIMYDVTVVTPDGCTGNFKLTVEVGADADNCGQIWYGLGGYGANLDLGKVVDSPSANKGDLGAGVIGTTLTGTSAVAAYQTVPHLVYYVPHAGTNNYVYSYDNSLTTGQISQFRLLPGGVTGSAVNGMAFDKKGNLWIVDSSNTMWMLPATTEFGVTPTTWETTWENRGKILNIPAGGVGDMIFNWTGSMYFVANDASNNGHFYIITPLKLVGSANAEPEQIVQIPLGTGQVLTGLASHMDFETFFISATDGTNSYIYELNQTTAPNPIQVNLLKTHAGKIVGDLTSCGLPQNLWVGSATSTSLTEPSNWIYNLVPREGEDIEFADGYANNTKGITALNNLVIPTGTSRTIGNLINETSLKTIVSAGGSLTVAGSIIGSETDPDKLKIEASTTLPNGTLILSGQPCDSVVMGTVQMYARGYQGDPVSWTDTIPNSPTYNETFTYSYLWQYFGVPVKAIQADPTFYGSALRKYNEKKNGTAYYQKWENLNNSSILEAFYGYEITQKQPKIVTMQGALVFCNDTLTLTRQAQGVLDQTENLVYYGLGYNIFGNSYTSAIRIDKMIFPTDAPVEKTVYLYNTGNFASWAAGGGGQPAGTYTAVPQNTAPIVSDNQIPSMQGFLLKFDNSVTTPGDSAKVILVYTDDGVMPNT